MLKGQLEPEHGRRSRIILEIRESGADVVYVKGKENAYADALSRMNTKNKIKADWMKEKPIHDVVRNKRQEMNDIETNPGPIKRQSWREYQQWDLAEYRIETAQALHRIDDRKKKEGKQPSKEYLLKRVLDLEEKERLIYENQHPIPGRKRDPEIMAAYAQITEEEWTYVANEKYKPKTSMKKEEPKQYTVSQAVKKLHLLFAFLCLMSTCGIIQCMPETTKIMECPMTPENLVQVSITRKKSIMDVYKINNKYQKIPCWDYIMREHQSNQVSFRNKRHWKIEGKSLSRITNFMLSPLIKKNTEVNDKLWFVDLKSGPTNEKIAVRMALKMTKYGNDVIMTNTREMRRPGTYEASITQTTCYIQENEVYDKW